mgnify:CR=1 FL=1
MNTLGALLLKSIGAGYSAINIVGRNSNIKILEFAPLGTQSHLLVYGPYQDIQNFISGLRTLDIERTVILKDLNEDLLKKYVGQNNSNMKDFLLIFESDFVGDLFLYAQEFCGYGLDIVDFRVQRTTHSPSYLILTGHDANKIKTQAQDLKRANVKITYINSLSDGLRNYLDIQK